MWHHRSALGSRFRIPLLPLFTCICFAAAVALWLGWQLAVDGPAPYLKAARDHLRGHFGTWGSTVNTDARPLTRPTRFIKTLLVFSLGGWWPSLPTIRLPATVCWLGLTAVGGVRLLRHSYRPVRLLALTWSLPYLIWLVFGQAVDLPRQHFPLAVWVCVVAALGLPHRLWQSVPIGSMAIASVAFVTWPLALEHHETPMGEQQLAEFLRLQARSSRVVLITHNISPLVRAMAPRARQVTARSGGRARQVQELQQERFRVFATDKALTADDLSRGEWVPVVRFCQNSFIRPWGSQWLVYEFAPGSTPPTHLECFIHRGP